MFANGGYKVSPYIISKVTDSEGKILSQAEPDKAGVEENRVIDERNAFLMDSMLKDVVKFGTATRALVLKRTDIAGKTGTSQKARDALFVGYTARMVAGVWLGNDDDTATTLSGGNVPTEIWSEFMTKAHEGLPVTPLAGASPPAHRRPRPAARSP